MTTAEYRAHEQSVPWSDVSRNSRTVAEKAAHGPVRLIRRGVDTDLILISADQYDTPDAGVFTALRLTDAYTELHDRDAAARRVFPWIEFLTDGEQGEFIRILFTKLEAAASLSSYSDFQRTVGSWRGTAENYAAGIVPAADDALDWLDDPASVERP